MSQLSRERIQQKSAEYRRLLAGDAAATTSKALAKHRPPAEGMDYHDTDRQQRLLSMRKSAEEDTTSFRDRRRSHPNNRAVELRAEVVESARRTLQEAHTAEDTQALLEEKRLQQAREEQERARREAFLKRQREKEAALEAEMASPKVVPQPEQPPPPQPRRRRRKKERETTWVDQLFDYFLAATTCCAQGKQ